MGVGRIEGRVKMKKLLVLLTLILVALAMVGCVDVKVTRIMGADASVIDRVEFVLDEDELNAHGYTLDYAHKKAIELLTNEGYTIATSTPTNVVMGEKVYPTLAEFREVYGSSTSEPDSEGFLFDVYGKVQSTPFSSLIKNGKIKEKKDLYFSNFTDLELKDISYTYVYVTSYKSIQSDAVVTEKDGYYYHEWNFTADEVEFATMYLAQTIPNKTGWYFISIVVALLIVAVGYGIITYKGKRKDKENSYGE